MKEKKSYGYVVVAIIFCALFIGNYAQYQLSPLAGRIMEDLNLTASQYSSIFSAPMIPAIFFSIAAGSIADKIGVKQIVTIGMAISVAGLILRPFASSYGVMLLAMIMAGAGTAFLNANNAKIIGNWFEPAKVSAMVGITLVGSTLAMAVGLATTALLPSIRFAYWLAAGIGAVILVLWVIFLKDSPESGKKDTVSKVQEKSQDSAGESVIASLKTAAKSKNVWITGICLLFVMGCNVCISAFLPTALQSRGISESGAGVYTSVIMIGSMCGAAFGPSISAKLKKNKPFLFLLGIVGGVAAMFGWKLPEAGMIAVLFILGAAMGTMIPLFMSFPILLPEIGPKYSGSAGGLISTIQLLGAVILPTYVIAPIAGSNYTLSFLLAGGCLVLAGVFSTLLPEIKAN